MDRKLITIDELYVRLMTVREIDPYSRKDLAEIRQALMNPQIEEFLVFSGSDADWERKYFPVKLYHLINDTRMTRVADIDIGTDVLTIGFIDSGDVFNVKGKLINLTFKTDKDTTVHKPNMLTELLFCKLHGEPIVVKHKTTAQHAGSVEII